MDDDDFVPQRPRIVLSDDAIRQVLRIRIGDGLDELMGRWLQRDKIADTVVRSAILQRSPFRAVFEPREREACINAGYEFLERRGFTYNASDKCWYPKGKGINTYN